MAAECNQFVVEFHPRRPRESRARFNGRAIINEGGSLLLREVVTSDIVTSARTSQWNDWAAGPRMIRHQMQRLQARLVTIGLTTCARQTASGPCVLSP